MSGQYFDHIFALQSKIRDVVEMGGREEVYIGGSEQTKQTHPCKKVVLGSEFDNQPSPDPIPLPPSR
jgi:hypothetical protein